jgi:hypothetical protein
MTNIDLLSFAQQSKAGEADRLNHGCFCVTLDRKSLAEVLDRDVGMQGFAEQLNASHPTLFSNVPVFVPSVALAEMARVVGAVEAAARLRAVISALLGLSWAMTFTSPRKVPS